MAIKKRKLKLKSLLKSIGFYIALIVVTVFLVVLIRVFVFAVFTIPSNSMAPSILTGDKILVNKLLFGGRIHDIFNSSSETQIRRVKGMREIKHNDILVFNFPYKKSWNKIEIDFNQYYVKRCIALPGDVVKIKNGFYKISGYSEPLGLISSQKKLSQTSDENLMQIEGIYNTFPYDPIHNWNIKSFGPLHIPKKGDSIHINTENFTIYKKLIEDETKGELSIKDHVVYLNSQKLDHYVFNTNYYFLVGDNGLDSQDSRYWGMLPEYCIVGVVTRIWSSIDPHTSKYRTDRILKKVR